MRSSPTRPNLSGLWGAGHAMPIDPALVGQAASQAPWCVPDAGAPELPAGNFGGLRPQAGGAGRGAGPGSPRTT